MIICFSGIDSSGKSTQLSVIAKKLGAGPDRIKWNRFGYTPTFEALKKCFRFIMRRSLPDQGPSDKRDQLLKRSFLGKIWFKMAAVDFFFYHIIYVRLLSFWNKNVLLDRGVLDAMVDISIHFDRDIEEVFDSFSLLIRFLPKQKVVLFLVEPRISYFRSIDKGELFPETVEEREFRIKKYRTAFHLLKLYKNGIETYFFDSSFSTVEEIQSEVSNKLGL